MTFEAQYADLDFLNVSRIINLPDAVLGQQPVTLAQLQGASLGLAWKDNVRAAATGNVNLAAPGATFDGVALANGDRVLLLAQTAQAENGIYVWSGAAVALVRSSDANTANSLENAIVSVDEGTTYGGATFRQTQVNFTLGTNPVVFANFFPTSGAATETSAGIIELATQAETDAGTDDARAITPLKLANSVFAHRGLAVDIGDGTTTTFTINHPFNTRDVSIDVRRNSGNYDYINVSRRATTTGSVQVVFAPGLPPTTNQFRVLIQRVA